METHPCLEYEKAGEESNIRIELGDVNSSSYTCHV